MTGPSPRIFQQKIQGEVLINQASQGNLESKHQVEFITIKTEAVRDRNTVCSI